MHQAQVVVASQDVGSSPGHDICVLDKDTHHLKNLSSPGKHIHVKGPRD